MDLDEFFSAAKRGDAATLRDFIARGVDINARNPIDWNATLYAAENGHALCLDLHIHDGANIMLHTGTGLTPLHRAAGLGHTECARLLLAAGACPDALDVIGRTPAMHALMGANFDVLCLLFDAGSDLTIADHSENTLLDHAENHAWTEGDSHPEAFVRSEIERRALLSHTQEANSSRIAKSI